MRPLSLALVLTLVGASLAQELLIRDGHGHGHGHHAQPLLELNETEITLYHDPTPPSYYTIDWDVLDPKRHPGLIITHALLMFFAFFVCLPMGLALRSAKHPLRGVAVGAFYGTFLLACSASSLYRKTTPDMYPHQRHSRHGYLLLFASLALTAIDTFAASVRIFQYVRAGRPYSFRGLWSSAVGREMEDEAANAEYAGLISEEPESMEEAGHEMKRGRTSYDHGTTAQWANHVRHHSTHSDGTLFMPSSPHSEATLHDAHLPFVPRVSLVRRIGRALFAITERLIIVTAFGISLSGIVVYTGGCRQNYINGCLAHLIKGGIFWCYGIASFARYLGWGAGIGWAWNLPPQSGKPTAEFVESAVIFIYGITNVWMERFGAQAGDPFTTKQLQHIGIAIMFWGAGLVGMAVESKVVRRWLAGLAVNSSETVSEPKTYTASFNPFPALVIGVTGSVMAAHFQTYLFQVQIHSLWGNLLLAFAVMRCITYFFVWVSPPKSTLPSRPPTEALASFFLTAGGISFMFSTEELTIAAMRRGRDDIMLFVVAAVAFTCIAFCWTIGVVGFHAWVKQRSKPAVSYRDTA
ncbi:unnamed protein product [Mycena citricolor]|uniref:Integral membrane protein n=1 Tax=Mycena citricolor TaxID=2018698 RepID=A0AAD2HGQ3_9AGAR|nr:unnamed protein product [Mycena citricolor]